MLSLRLSNHLVYYGGFSRLQREHDINIYNFVEIIEILALWCPFFGLHLPPFRDIVGVGLFAPGG